MRPAALILEVPLFGIALLWLLVLTPAAVVTLIKERLSLFLVGWLTFGIAWIIGAVALAPPDSAWARRFYGEERLAQAADPLRYPRSRRTLLRWLGGAFAAVLVLGIFASRPAPILGVDGEALQKSVGGFLIGGLSLGPCERRGGRIWGCQRHDDQYSGTVGYRVSVDRLGCWDATRVGSPGEGSRKHLSGCVTLLEFVF